MKYIAAVFIALLFTPQTVLAENQKGEFSEIREFKTKPLTKSILEQLRKGGYVIYMRHGLTDTSQPDALNIDLNDCTTQRQMSDEGRHSVANIGNKMRKAKIPQGEVFSSPMCRAKESAQIAFGKKFTVDNLLMYNQNMSDKDKFLATQHLRELVSRPVQEHTNRIIVSHSQNMMALIGYLPSPEGTMVIFQPLGNHQFNYIASVKPTQWAEILP